MQSKKYSEFSAVILAGGKNSRFNGLDKALVEINGEKIIDTQVKVLASLFDDILLITNSPEHFENYPNLKQSTDNFLGFGPLAGIESALKLSKRKYIFVVSCDMPGINRDFIELLLKSFISNTPDILASKVDDKIHPMFAIYSSTIYNRLFNYLQNPKRLSIISFLPEVEHQFYEFENNLKTQINFYNINSAEDLADYIKITSIL